MNVDEPCHATEHGIRSLQIDKPSAVPADDGRSANRNCYMRMTTAFLVLAVAVGCSDAQIDPPTDSITVDQINSQTVIGHLERPLLERLELVATVVDGDSLGTKEHSSSYLLKVNSVDGKSFDSDHLFACRVPPPNEAEDTVGMVSYHLGFSELANRSNGGIFDSERLAELRRSYVGLQVRLTAYEIGSFHRAYTPSGQGLGTELIILRANRVE